jgi:hypothetical protein
VSVAVEGDPNLGVAYDVESAVALTLPRSWERLDQAKASRFLVGGGGLNFAG